MSDRVCRTLTLNKRRLFGVGVSVVIASFVFFGGCGKKDGREDSQGAAQQRSGAAGELIVISPHNENIRYEFETAFEKYYRQQTGETIDLQWRDVGGGSSAILRYLRNVYSRSETAGIDVVFGGGEYTFQKLAEEGLLVPIEMQPDVLENIPATFGGMEMYDPGKLWCGNVVSSFGFIYNKDLLKMQSIAEPQSWTDLGRDDLFGLVMLADPTQSGSIAAAYEMIVQSADDWPKGWARLMMILSNAKKFTDSSGTAAQAPVIGEAIVATCIDFYGTMRVAEAPEMLGYRSPRGQTGFTPDPVAILKNAPNEDAAQMFIQFVLSLDGQGLWALPPGHEAGPERYNLNRPPIRKDFYKRYDADVPDYIARPYAEGAEMFVDADIRSVRYDVLIQLVKAAAIDNRSQMQDARKKIIETNHDPKLLAEFVELPENIDTLEEVRQIHDKLNDAAQSERIVSGWVDYFYEKYEKIAD